jgi:glyceraldehyde 3-phosphate dehydrogenase
VSNIAIVGFGRIGRSVVKAGLSANHFEPSVVVDIAGADEFAALFAVDTNYGRWHEPVSATADSITVGGRSFKYFNAKEPMPRWDELGVDLVVDCTGRATTRAGAQPHLDKGAKRVLVSGPSKTLDDCDAVLLPGINLDTYDADKHHIVSMASCTTNALAPVVKVLLETVGIRDGFFSTVHAYTNTQSLTDQPMKDRRDSWAAAENLIPSSSGAAKALKFLWPDLNIAGKAYRIPVRTGSIVELNIRTDRSTSVQELNDAFLAAADSAALKGIFTVLTGEWASSRIVGETASSLLDAPLTAVQNGDLVSVASWYDNESGFSMRLAETIAAMA